MTKVTVTMVAAVARNGVIGADGGMPWHLPADLRRFKALTMGHPMVMGRRTFESIGRLLPGRRTIVVTRNREWSAPGVETVGSVEAALRLAASGGADSPVMVVGGGEIYAAAMPFADRLEITEVDRDASGDTVFPAISPDTWEREATERSDGLSWVSYRRRIRT